MRYSRQEALIGRDKQAILSGKTVAVIGVGAIGTVSAELAARSGINLILIDRDIVELHNLQRQLLYKEADVGNPKALAAKEALKSINSEVSIEAFPEDLTYENIELLDRADVILDCTDNFETRYLVNDYCVKNRRPWIYSAGIKTIGTMVNFLPFSFCFRCIFNSNTGLETCESSGILNSTTAAIASFQVANAVNMLIGRRVGTEMIRLDVASNTIEKIKVRKRDSCAACNGIFEYLNGDKGSKANKMCGSDTFQIKGDVDFDILRAKHQSDNEFFIKINDRVSVFRDGRAIIKAKDEKEARSLYSKFIGN